MKSAQSIIFLLSFLLSLQGTLLGQLQISTNQSGEDLASALVGAGVTIDSVILNCPGEACGSFTNVTNVDSSIANVNLQEGIILTTGLATNAIGPNENNGTTGFHQQDLVDNDLSTLAGGRAINDVCVLEFDLVSVGDQVTFRYVFASEEYQEFVCSSFNDVFGFFVSGPRPGDPQNPYVAENIAVVTHQKSGKVFPVAINSVNPGVVGSAGIENNCTAPIGSLDFNHLYVDNPIASNSLIEYDGFTVVLTASIDLVPCETYHFKLGVVDVTDSSLDSGIFIEAGSFNSSAILADGTTKSPSCPGTCDGAIDVSTSGNRAPYQFNWDTGDTTEDLINLCAGIYHLTITDRFGCTEELSFELSGGVDSIPPKIYCPKDMRLYTDAGECGAVVNFQATAKDNCSENVSISYSPASGSFFQVGTTMVSSMAVDKAGNASTCYFSVKVKDVEPPKLKCPMTVDLSCELDPVPVNTGNPIVSDNCQVQQVIYADKIIGGGCTNEQMIARQWKVTDVYGNESVCQQKIQIIDTTPPTVTCPADITVSCSISTANVGLPVATDNCSDELDLTYTDVVLSGDCDWNCVVERSWSILDDCGNESNCRQVITKDVTPLIKQALSSKAGATSGLQLGATDSTHMFTIHPEDAGCVVIWLPASGDRPAALRRQVVGVDMDCQPGLNPLDENGKLVNPLFGAVLELSLYVRLDPAFAAVSLRELDCEIPPIVMQTLQRENNEDPQIKHLLRITNLALGNLVLVPHLEELLSVLECINVPLHLCDAGEPEN